MPKPRDRHLTDESHNSDSDSDSHTDIGGINAADSESDSDDELPLRGYPDVGEYVCLSNYESNEVFVLLTGQMGNAISPDETTVPDDILM